MSRLRYTREKVWEGCCLLREYLCAAERGQSVWIGELREAFFSDSGSRRAVLRLTGCDGTVRDTELWFPRWQDDAERSFVQEYLSAFVFNLLSCFGGRELRFYLQEDKNELASLIDELNEIFALRDPHRSGYGKVISIANRLNRAFGAGWFRFAIDDLSNYRSIQTEEIPCGRELGESLRDLTARANTRFCCGIDVGGTDIKAAVSRDGKLLFTKEYDWDPASFSTARELIEPILLLARLLRLGVVCPYDDRFLFVLPKQADLEKIRGIVRELESEFAAGLRCFDSVGLSFPDVVIRDRILGGETPKTSGLRRNPDIVYEEEFAKLDELRTALLSLCLPGARVRLANDGSIAAFTAAVEMASKGETVSKGVFAHSLGTDLGTGWLNEAGELPPLPLEMYDFLLDLGSRPQRAFQPEDIRSVRNENSGLPDARKYLGQSAAFRLTEEIVPGLLSGFLSGNSTLLCIRKQPEDMRKACLEHLMRCAEEGDAGAEEVFRQIGRNLGQISGEIEYLLHPQTHRRFLYGRFAKRPACFDLLREGFAEVQPELELIAADDGLACSPLMRQLSAKKEVTVAQFGQAVGAIYFGLS